jgi:hypothetical protein
MDFIKLQQQDIILKLIINMYLDMILLTKNIFVRDKELQQMYKPTKASLK